MLNRVSNLKVDLQHAIYWFFLILISIAMVFFAEGQSFQAHGAQLGPNDLHAIAGADMAKDIHLAFFVIAILLLAFACKKSWWIEVVFLTVAGAIIYMSWNEVLPSLPVGDWRWLSYGGLLGMLGMSRGDIKFPGRTRSSA